MKNIIHFAKALFIGVLFGYASGAISNGLPVGLLPFFPLVSIVLLASYLNRKAAKRTETELQSILNHQS